MNNSKVNTKVTLDEMVLKSLYYRYKDFTVPISVIVVCILLFLFLIIPQIQSFLAMRDSISGDSQKLSTLQQNLKIISSFDDNELNNYLDISTRALPAEKDFAGVLQAISSSAAGAGTILGDYSFQIGDITADTKSKTTQLPLQLSITIKGDLTTARRFIEELKNQLPLSDVTSVSVNSNGTIAVTAIFYYAPLPKISFDDSIPLLTISTKEKEMLKLLDNPSNPDSITNVQASTPTPTPFSSITVTPTVVVSLTPTIAASPSGRISQ